jgi:ankyrin repeat protein
MPIVKEIMKYDPDITLMDEYGDGTIQFTKTYNINLKDLKDLITQEFKDLKIAIQDNNLHEVERLLDNLKYIDETDYNGYTILMYAITTSKNLEIVKAILRKDPRLSIKNLDGQTALDLAKSKDMVELLDGSKPVKPRLLKPISSFKLQVKPVTIHAKASKELLDLQDAITRNDLTVVEDILDRLKDINEVDSDGWTILMYAVMTSNNIEIVKAILKKNPNLSIKTPTRQTALGFAKLITKKEMIELLESYISKPVNVNVRPVNVKPKERNDKCDKVDSLTVAKLNEVFTEINKPIPAAKVLKAERLQILKNLLGC